MKIRKVSDHIYKLEFWMWWKISNWIVVRDKDVIVIDSGISFMTPKIWREAASHGIVKALFLTHGHSDHIGGADFLHQRFGTPVYINPEDIVYAEGNAPFPGRKKRKRLIKPGILTSYYESGRAGIALLKNMGLEVYHTPGHSPGHAVYFHRTDGVLIAGDLFTSKHGCLMPPMKQFTADMDTALKNGAEIIDKLKPQKVSLCHGDDVVLSYEGV